MDDMKDPIGTSLLIIAVFIICLIGGGIYWLGYASRDGAEARKADKTEERINEAITGAGDCHWFDRLHNNCK